MRARQSKRAEGAGERYLIQHSAGSGKSNSIAWTAHQLAALYNDEDATSVVAVMYGETETTYTETVTDPDGRATVEWGLNDSTAKLADGGTVELEEEGEVFAPLEHRAFAVLLDALTED